MQRLMGISVLCLSLAGARALGVMEPPTATLPSVDAAPLALLEAGPAGGIEAAPEIALPATEPTPRALEAEPEVQATVPEIREPTDPETVTILTHLRSRHTGLSKAELPALAELIVAEARRHGIEPRLALALIRVESGCFNYAVSQVGAMGLMQLMPPTGEELAHKLGIDWRGPDSLFDPRVNVRLGLAYLKELSDRYESTPTALAAYNWGPGRIDRRLRRGQGVPKLYATQVMKRMRPTT